MTNKDNKKKESTSSNFDKLLSDIDKNIKDYNKDLLDILDKQGIEELIKELKK